MSRLYVVENVYSITGGMADHRLRLRSGQIEAFARALAADLASKGVALPAEIQSAVGTVAPDEAWAKWLSAVAADLAAHRGKSIVVAGRGQPATVHALAHALNVALGNLGQTVTFTSPVLPETGAAGVDTSLGGLVGAMKQNQVKTLVIVGGNPAYDAPADFDVPLLLKSVATVLHLTLHENETSRFAHMVAPRSHYLESWSDVRAHDGTAAIVQPLIEPLYGSLSDVELISYFVDAPSNRGYDLVRAYWQTTAAGVDFEKRWRRMLHDGVIADTAFPTVDAQLSAADVGTAIAAKKLVKSEASASSLEIVFRPDARVYDGRFANNGWLQEMPDPLTKLTWDNAALMSPKTARELRVRNGDMLAVSYGGRSLEIPVWIVPGHADYSVAVNLGYGRTVVGRVGTKSGFNAYLLRTSTAPWFGAGLTASKTGEHFPLATTQEHGRMENRPIVREATVAQYKADPKFAQKMVEHPPLESLFDEHVYEGQQWGMAVDLGACTGCNACVVACQAENNIPIVGKSRVLMGREMHWMRMDRYFAGDEETPELVNQPLMCQQCQNAPCEPVCPVAATTHSQDGGLNDMVYNRCIGTRYCANNCPFKVRRFNFFNFHEGETEVEQMQFNPDVTVRMRGVMEKCTYCVQRIHAAKRTAKIAGKLQIEDGAVVTACAQVCPAEAIVFGDINDPNTRVSKLKARDLNYGLLVELNIKPRTSYLARIRNPNPELG